MVGCDEIASSATRWKGSATLGMPSRIGVVANVHFGIGPMLRKPRAATLIHCSQGSLALIRYLGAWKLLDIGM